MKKVILVFLISFIVYLIQDNFFSKKMVIGRYVNCNYSNNFNGDIPHKKDTLELFKNGTFQSSFYGFGNYKLDHQINGTKFNLQPTSGQMGLNTSISRTGLFGSIKINLVRDLDQYYMKID